MLKFIIGLILIIAAVTGGYYYFSVRQNHEAVKDQTEAQLQVHVQQKKIPAGAVMEDGTLPE